MWHKLAAQSAVPRRESCRERERERPGYGKGMIKAEEEEGALTRRSTVFQERLTSAYECRLIFECQLTGATFEALR